MAWMHGVTSEGLARHMAGSEEDLAWLKEVAAILQECADRWSLRLSSLFLKTSRDGLQLDHAGHTIRRTEVILKVGSHDPVGRLSRRERD